MNGMGYTNEDRQEPNTFQKRGLYLSFLPDGVVLAGCGGAERGGVCADAMGMAEILVWFWPRSCVRIVGSF